MGRRSFGGTRQSGNSSSITTADSLPPQRTSAASVFPRTGAARGGPTAKKTRKAGLGLDPYILAKTLLLAVEYAGAVSVVIDVLKVHSGYCWRG